MESTEQRSKLFPDGKRRLMRPTAMKSWKIHSQFAPVLELPNFKKRTSKRESKFAQRNENIEALVAPDGSEEFEGEATPLRSEHWPSVRHQPASRLSLGHGTTSHDSQGVTSLQIVSVSSGDSANSASSMHSVHSTEATLQPRTPRVRREPNPEVQDSALAYEESLSMTEKNEMFRVLEENVEPKMAGINPQRTLHIITLSRERNQTSFSNFSFGLRPNFSAAILKNEISFKMPAKHPGSVERKIIFSQYESQITNNDRFPPFQVMSSPKEKQKGQVSGNSADVAKDGPAAAGPAPRSTSGQTKRLSSNTSRASDVERDLLPARAGREAPLSPQGSAPARHQASRHSQTRPSIAFPTSFESVLTSGIEAGSLACACVGLPASLLLALGLWLNVRQLLLVWLVNMTAFVALDVLYILHSLLLFCTSRRPAAAASGPEFAMYHTVNFFVCALNVYAILCVASQYEEVAAAAARLPSNGLPSNVLPRVTSNRYERRSFVTKKKDKLKKSKQSKIASTCVESTFVSKTDSAVSYRDADKAGLRGRGKVSFTASEAVRAGDPRPLSLADADAREGRAASPSAVDAYTSKQSADLTATGALDLCDSDVTMSAATSSVKITIESSAMMVEKCNHHPSSGSDLPEKQQLLLNVNQLNGNAQLGDVSLIKRRQALRFNSLQPVQQRPMLSTGLHLSSLSLNYPESSLLLSGQDFRAPLPTAPLNHSKLQKYKINFFPKTESEHDKQPLERDFSQVWPEPRCHLGPKSGRVASDAVPKFPPPSQSARAPAAVCPKNRRSSSYASLQEHTEARSAPKSVYFNSTVEEVVLVDFAENIVESSFDCSESTSSTCSGSSEDETQLNLA